MSLGWRKHGGPLIGTRVAVISCNGTSSSPGLVLSPVPLDAHPHAFGAS